MQPHEFDTLGVSTDLRTAARALGISKSTAYELAKRDDFPVRVIRVGGRYVVPTAELKALFGIGDAA